MAEVTKEELQQIIGHVAEAAVKHWLQVNNLQHSAQNTDAFYERLQKLIRKNKLTLDRLRQVALEIEENANKRIYLRKIEVPEVLRSELSYKQYLQSIGMALSEPNKSIRYPSGPTLNYINWSNNGIQIKYSESQEHRIFNRESGEVSTILVTNYALAIVDLSDGFTQIRLDPVADRFPHKDPITNMSKYIFYVKDYFEEFAKILGKCNYEIYDLIQKTDRLSKTDLLRLQNYNVLGSDNLYCRMNKPDDVRKSERYKIFVDEDPDSVCQGFAGWWNPEQSGGQISREVFMRLNRKTSMVSFYRDCLAGEVDYAIKRIREA